MYVLLQATSQPGTSKTQSKLGMQKLAKAHAGPVGWSCLDYGMNMYERTKLSIATSRFDQHHRVIPQKSMNAQLSLYVRFGFYELLTFGGLQHIDQQ